MAKRTSGSTRTLPRNGRSRWAIRLQWAGSVKDEKTGELRFPPGKLTEVSRLTKRGKRRKGNPITGLLFTGTNREASRKAARSTRRRSSYVQSSR